MTRRDAKRGPALVARTESAAISENLEAQNNELNDIDVAALSSFFKLLDEWDREAKRNA
jgi:hypothetical protein